MVKSLDFGSEDDDYNTDGGEEGHVEAENSNTYDGDGDPVYGEEHEAGAALSVSKADGFSTASCVHKCLNFSCDSINDHEKLSTHPKGAVVSADCHGSDNEPRQDKESIIPVRLKLDTGSAVVCSCKGSNNRKPEPDSHRYAHHRRASMFNLHTRSSPKSVSAHMPKHNPCTGESKRFSNKSVRNKNKNRISRGHKLSPEIIGDGASEHGAETMPVFQAKRTAGYNYGLPLSSPPTTNKV